MCKTGFEPAVSDWEAVEQTISLYSYKFINGSNVANNDLNVEVIVLFYTITFIAKLMVNFFT